MFVQEARASNRVGKNKASGGQHREPRVLFFGLSKEQRNPIQCENVAIGLITESVYFLWLPTLDLETCQAFRLACGFSNRDKCHACSGPDYHNPHHDARQANQASSPFYAGNNPLLRIPGISAETIMPDLCHTSWAGLRFGCFSHLAPCKEGSV